MNVCSVLFCLKAGYSQNSLMVKERCFLSIVACCLRLELGQFYLSVCLFLFSTDRCIIFTSNPLVAMHVSMTKSIKQLRLMLPSVLIHDA